MSILWHHQQEAFDRLKSLRAAGLFLEMGTGKTLVAIRLVEEWRAARVLVISPKAVMPVWESEFGKHTEGWKVTLLNQATMGKKEETLKQTFKQNGRQAVVVNYESAWREPLGSMFMKYPPDVVVLDESHKIKAPGGVASRFFSRLGPKVRRRLILTGSPMPHSPMDIYAQYRTLDPSIFGFSFTRFRARYAVMGGFGGKQIVKFVNLDELHERMYRIAFRVKAEDVLDLPETLDQTITFELGTKARRIYDHLERDLIAEVEEGKIISVPSVLVKLLRLSQLTGGWLTPDESSRPERVDEGKAETLKELLEGVGAEPVVIFCRFTADLAAVRAVCKDLELTCCELSGRVNEVQDFLNGKSQVIATQIQSGSLGIDLTRARYCIFYSLDYSLGTYEQARARVHRPGQTRPVTYYHLTARKTVDEKVLKALEKRADLVKYVIDELRKK